jgi:diacylglycerol kinase
MRMKNRNEKFNIKNRLLSFKYAFQGLRHVLKSEHNFRIHLMAAFVAIALGVFFRINRNEWLVITLCIGMVLSLELINSAVESLVDLISPQKSEKAGIIKDTLAAGVLIAAVCSLIAGVIIMLPYLLNLFKQ